MTPSVVDPLLPVYYDLPEEWQDSRVYLVEQLRKITEAINSKESGIMVNQELQNAQKFLKGTGTEFRSPFRKVLDLDQALPNAGTLTFAHGISSANSASFTLTNLYLASTDPVNFESFSLQYYSLDAADSIRLRLTSTNIEIITTLDYSAFTRNFVIIEFLKEK